MEAGAEEVAIFGAASESFSRYILLSKNRRFIIVLCHFVALLGSKVGDPELTKM